jgi:hypothetical protein
MSGKKSRNPLKRFKEKLWQSKSAETSADNIASPDTTAVIQQDATSTKSDGTPIVRVLKKG